MTSLPRRRWYEFSMALLVLLNGVTAFIRTAHHAPSWMIFFEDDFFYYLKIAQNISSGSGSTFNGLVATNGYHPLWLLFLTGLCSISGNGKFIYLSVVALSILSALLTYWLCAKILEQAGVSYWLRYAVAAYVALYAMSIFYTGMEVILAVPFMLLLVYLLGRPDLWKHGFRQALLLGLVISAAILSRLDLIFFLALLSFWFLINPANRQLLRRKHLLGVGLGVTPIAAYFLYNRFAFGIWMPVSGMAKQLRFSHYPSMPAWRSIYAHQLSDWVALLPIELALISLPFAWKSLSATQRFLFPSLLLFQPVYVLFLSCLSDWKLWGWYRYPSRAALCASVVVFYTWPVTKPLMQKPVVALLIVLSVCVQVARAHWISTTGSIYQLSTEVVAFSRSHPGVYAMGDQSGMIGYSIGYPVVQTEGLVMGREFLERIERQEPLLQALSEYHARYYIATSLKPFDACFHASEPAQAGKTSAHMEAEICQAPVATFFHDDRWTFVFDLAEKPASFTNSSR